MFHDTDPSQVLGVQVSAMLECSDRKAHLELIHLFVTTEDFVLRRVDLQFRTALRKQQWSSMQ